MRAAQLLLAALYFADSAIAQSALRTRADTITPAAQVFLIGDAGGALPNPVLPALSDQLQQSRAPRIVIFLGDNVYPSGIPNRADAAYSNAEARLRAQIDAVRRTGARALFVPGNHDWGSPKAIGNAQVLRQDEIIRGVGDPQVVMSPSSGCPGPDVVDIEPSIRIITIDTEWWLRMPARRNVDGKCVTDEHTILDSLSRLMATAATKRVIVAGHHPLRSAGPHGGNFSWHDHLFPFEGGWYSRIPLPIVGSFALLSRRMQNSPQDLHSPPYAALRSKLDSLFNIHHPLLYAAGHEHNLQIIASSGAQMMVVSGGGSYDRGSSVGSAKDVLMSAQENGFMRLDLYADAHNQLTVFTVNGAGQSAVRFTTGVPR